MLKRHVEHHTQDSSSDRTLVACVSCHERKLKCDEDIPCASCTRSSIECSRAVQGQEGPTNPRPNVGDGTRSDSMSRGDQILTNEMPGISEMSGVLPGSGRQQPWFPPLHGSWSSPFTTSEIEIGLPSDLNANSSAQWAADSGERMAVDAAFPTPVTEDSPFMFTTTEPQAESFPGAPGGDEDQGNKAAPPAASQLPTSSGLPREGQVTDLQSYLEKDSMSSTRDFHVYFSKIHPFWPVLHAPTFDIAKASDVLRGSMIMLASWLEGEPDYIKLAPLVFDAVTETLLVRICFPDIAQTTNLHVGF